MRKALILALALVGGCDFLPAEDRRVELYGQVLDAETRAPIAGALWGVSNSCGFGTYVSLDGGRTDVTGHFKAQYEYPVCGDAVLGLSVPEDERYDFFRREVYGRGRVTISVLLEKRKPQVAEGPYNPSL